MDEETTQPLKQLETARGGAGRKGKTAIGVGDDGGNDATPPPPGSSPAGEIEEPPENFRPRTIVCERDDTIRHGLTLMLAPVAKVVGEAGDGMTAYRLINELLPELIVIDVDLDELDGLELLRRLQSEGNTVKSLIATDVYHATKYFHQLFRAGAGGIYRKSTGKQALRAAIRALMGGHQSVDPNVKQLIEPKPSIHKHYELNKNEIDVLIRIDLRNKEIAQELEIDLKKVEKVILSLFTKLGVPSRAHAALKVGQMGWELLPKIGGRDPQTGISHEYSLALQHALGEISRHQETGC